ncbi:MAG: RsmE family RNA methyltransferase [Pseudohongiellaceae bacterium]|jgi:RsmE family RNA methyltransferase
MNIILFSANELSENQRLVLSDKRFQHIRNIHRSKTGDSVRLGKINGDMGTGTILTIDEQQVEIDVTLSHSAPEKLPLKIVLALPRPKMIRRIFRTAAELGVSELIIINSYKVEKSFWQSPALNEDNIYDYLLDGLQQAKDTVMPKISFHKRFKPFAEDILPDLSSNTKKLLAHPGIGELCPLAINEPITLAIGPEGGFIPYEVEKFLAAGFEGIHLGPRILKVENALTVLTAKLYS